MATSTPSIASLQGLETYGSPDELNCNSPSIASLQGLETCDPPPDRV